LRERIVRRKRDERAQQSGSDSDPRHG